MAKAKLVIGGPHSARSACGPEANPGRAFLASPQHPGIFAQLKSARRRRRHGGACPIASELADVGDRIAVHGPRVSEVIASILGADMVMLVDRENASGAIVHAVAVPIA